MSSADRYCKAYNDPKADIVLKSNDNVLFRIPSYVLKTHSSVFLDMLESSPIDALDASRRPIDIDANWTTLMLFLDLMIKPTVSPDSGAQNPSAILQLCDTFDCKIVIDRFMPCLMVKAKVDPWAMFCIADKCNRLDLAREAIKGMGGPRQANKSMGDYSTLDWSPPRLPTGLVRGVNASTCP